MHCLHTLSAIATLSARKMCFRNSKIMIGATGTRPGTLMARFRRGPNSDAKDLVTQPSRCNEMIYRHRFQCFRLNCTHQPINAFLGSSTEVIPMPWCQNDNSPRLTRCRGWQKGRNVTNANHSPSHLSRDFWYVPMTCVLIPRVQGVLSC